MEEFRKITIIGMGLIGGSIALALKKSKYMGQIIGCDISMATLIEAKGMGIIDTYYKEPSEAVKDADLIIMAVPVGYYAEIFKEINPYISSNAIITDVGSVKEYVEIMASKYLSFEIQFIGGHPMAGSEKGGIRAATSSLYENAYYFLTPNERTSQDTIEKLKKLVKNLGAYPVVITANEHDKIVAQISHIPHLTAVMLTNLLKKNNDTSYLSFVGGGFRDSTRIASGNPYMWQDIFLFNKKEVLSSIKVLEDMLKDFRIKLEEENTTQILTILKDAKEIRDKIPHAISKDYIPPTYDLIINAEDRPGILGELTQIIGKNQINIKEIEILHAREGQEGAIRIALESKEEQEKAYEILKNGSFPLTYRKDVD